MPKTNFTVKYDGKALATHEMDVALLAPALMGMQKVLDALVTATTEGEYRASLKIKGNTKAGSIEIELVTQAISNIQVVKSLFTEIFSSADATASANVISYVTAFFILVKKFGTKKPEKTEDLGNGNIKLHFGDEITIVNNYVYQVYNTFEVREAVYEAVKPLEEEGIDSFSIYQNSRKLMVEVNKEDISNFIPPKVNDSKHISEEITYLQIVTIKFNMSNKWQFTQGDSVINASILDDEFITKVRNRVPFHDGDILKVKLQKEQYQEKGKLKINYNIIEVLDHIKIEQQEGMDFDL